MTTAHPKRRDIDPATPFHEFPGPLLVSTARRFAELGVDEALAVVIRQPQSEAVVRKHLAAMRDELAVQVTRRAVVSPQRFRAHLIRGLYTPPIRQIENVRRWNAERSWNIPETWFTNLGPAPAWPDGRLKCVTLEVALPGLPETTDGEGKTIPAVPGYMRTLLELRHIICGKDLSSVTWPLPLDAEHVELLDGATYEPGLRWRVLDLGANWDQRRGISPVDVRNPAISPNVDALAALAHHRRLIRRMDGDIIPYLWLPGFVATQPGDRDRRTRVLRMSLHRNRRWLYVSADLASEGGPHTAVPVRLEVK